MSRARLKVLVADGTGTLAPTCVVFLAYWGHDVEVVHDALSLVRRAQAWRPDLVVSDASLDGTRAPAVVRALRARGRPPRTRCLIVEPAGAPDAAPFPAGWVVAGPLAVQVLRRVVDELAPAAGHVEGAGRREPA